MIVPLRCRTRRPTTLVALGMISLTCAGGDVAQRWEGTVRDSAGITVVANPSAGIWNTGDEWRLEENLVIGVAEGSSDYMFATISGVCVGSGGRIYVVDEMASSVSSYAPDGSFIRRFGRSGSGPGELGSDLGPCLMGSADTLAVPDMQNFRLTRFTGDGSFVSSTPFEFGSGIPIQWRIVPGGMIAVRLRFGMLDPNEPLGIPDAIVWWEEDGSPGDTALRIPRGDVITPSRGRAPGRAFYTLLEPEPLWVLMADAVVAVGSMEGYRVTYYGVNGNPTRLVSRVFDPIPVTRDDREILADAVESVFPTPVVQNVMGGIHFAEFFPPYHCLQVGPEQSLWLQRIIRPSDLSQEAREDRDWGPEDPELFLADPRLALGAPDWDVLDADGRYLGVVSMPERFEPLQFTGDAIYGVWRDEMDVQYVKRFRVVTD
jgi:hypothetical protein